VITYWRALRPIGCDYRFVFFFTREDGAIVGLYDGATPTTLWRPTSSWPAGEVLKVQAPPLPVARLHEVLLAVTPVGSDPWDKGARLRPEAASSAGLDTRDDGTLLRLFAFR
jgi:hypothetical protein